MAEILAAGDIDAFCVGEPWGSVAVETGPGALLLPRNAIRAFAPEKILAVRTGWAETELHLLGRLMRAVWRAGRWLGIPESRIAAAEILSRKPYLDLSSEVIDWVLSGRLIISGQADQCEVAELIEFHDGAANFPWRSQAKWIASRLAARNSLPRNHTRTAAT